MDVSVEELLTQWQLPDLIDSFKGKSTTGYCTTGWIHSKEMFYIELAKGII